MVAVLLVFYWVWGAWVTLLDSFISLIGLVIHLQHTLKPFTFPPTIWLHILVQQQYHQQRFLYSEQSSPRRLLHGVGIVQAYECTLQFKNLVMPSWIKFSTRFICNLAALLQYSRIIPHTYVLLRFYKFVWSCIVAKVIGCRIADLYFIRIPGSMYTSEYAIAYQ